MVTLVGRRFCKGAFIILATFADWLAGKTCRIKLQEKVAGKNYWKKLQEEIAGEKRRTQVAEKQVAHRIFQFKSALLEGIEQRSGEVFTLSYHSLCFISILSEIQPVFEVEGENWL